MKQQRARKQTLTVRGQRDYQQGCRQHLMGRGQSFQRTVLGKLEIHTQKNEPGAFLVARW